MKHKLLHYYVRLRVGTSVLEFALPTSIAEYLRLTKLCKQAVGLSAEEFTVLVYGSTAQMFAWIRVCKQQLDTGAYKLN